MLYNKNNVRKTNDKKILHKVGKQWKVVSVALLMAIGGGAVATHAANAQSNNGVNAATSTEVAEIANNKPATVSATSASASVAPKSASAAPKSASAAPKSVSYLSGSNGSAASYQAKTLNDKSAAQSASAVVNGYVNSLNAKFGNVTALLNDRTASASANAKSDANLANSYSAIAKASDNKSGMNSLAAKSGLTPNDYASNVAWNVENIYNPAVKSASTNVSALNLASGLAEKVMSVDWTNMSADANANSAIASANDAVANAKAHFNAYNDASNAVISNDNALTSATVASIEASGINAAMALKQSDDNSSVNSFAKSASLDATAVSSEVQAYAQSAVKSNVAPNYEFSNASSSSLVNGRAALTSATSDAASMYSASSVAAKANSVIASAVAAKPSLSANLVSAKSAASANSAVVASASAASNVANTFSGFVSGISSAMTGKNSSADLVNLLTFAATNANSYKGLYDAFKSNMTNSSKALYEAYEANDVASLTSKEGFNFNDLLAIKDAVPVIKSLTNLNGQGSQLKSALESAKNDPAVKAALENAKNDSKDSAVQNALNAAKSKAEANAKAAVKNDPAVKAAKSAVDNARDLNAKRAAVANLNSALNAAKSKAKANVQVAVENDPAVQNAVKNDPAVQNAVKNDPAVQTAIHSALSNGLNLSSLASSASTALSNANSASASYSNATDENVTLAGYYASSYSNEASSYAKVASNDDDQANAFYVANVHNPEFTSANAAMRNAQAAEPVDAAFAQAWGQQVLNWTPQFVTTEKSFGLYNVKDNKYTRLATVPANVRLHVSGVQIMDNGFVRYQTTYNGKKGTVTSYPSYVTPTYLFAAESANVVVNKNTPVYKSEHLSGATKTDAVAKAGHEYDGVKVVASFYGGVSRVQLGNNQFITGNTSVVSVANNSNNNQPNNSTNENNSKVSFWN